MAWPHSRLHTYVDNSTPVIAAADLNALQDAVIATVDATWSLKSLYVDGTGGTAVAPAQGRLYVRGGSGAPAVTLDVGGAWGAGASSAVTGAGAQDAWGEITVTAAGVPAANARRSAPRTSPKVRAA